MYNLKKETILTPELKKLYDEDFSFPRMAFMEWPFEFDPYARPLNEKLVLTERLAATIADAMAAELIERMKTGDSIL